MMRASRLLQILFWLFTTSAMATPAWAGAVDRDRREAEAKKRCDAGDARTGVAWLAEIYVATLDPIYVYRQALCYQRNGLDENAVERYREYLRRRRTGSPQGRERIESRIRELEAGGRPGGRDPAPLHDDTAPGSRPRKAAASTAPVLDILATPFPAAQQPAGAAASLDRGQSWQRFSSLILASGAGAALGTAVTFHVAREDSARRFNRNCFPFRLESCDQLESRVNTTQTGALVGYLAAALLAGGSTYLYLIAPENRRSAVASSPARSLATVTCGPSGMDGVACGGRF